MHLAQTHSLSENTSIAETKTPSLSDEAISRNSIHQVENSPKRYPAKAGSAKGLVWMSDDFDEPYSASRLDNTRYFCESRASRGSHKNSCGLLK
jgi:hypothetical protein